MQYTQTKGVSSHNETLNLTAFIQANILSQNVERLPWNKTFIDEGKRVHIFLHYKKILMNF